MSSPIDTQTNPTESTQGIIETISKLLDLLLQLENSTTQPTLNGSSSNNNNNDGSNGDNTGNNSNGYVVDDNNNNGVSSNNNNNNNGSSSSNNGDNTGNDGNGYPEVGNNNNGSGSGSGNENTINHSEEVNNHNGQENSNQRNGGSGRNSPSEREKLRKNLNQIKNSLTDLKTIEEGNLGKLIQTQLVSLAKCLDLMKSASTGSSSRTQTELEIQKISKEINKLKHKIPSLHKLSSVGSGVNQTSQMSNGSNPRRTVSGLLKNPHESGCFQGSSFYKEIEKIFNGLDVDKKFFLSCFAVFPENEVVKRRLLIYWWVGEGSVEITEEKAPEEIVDEYLKVFKEKGLIEPADKERRRQSTKSYTMHPLVRSALILLTKDAWLSDYDSKGKLTGIVSPNSRACLESSTQDNNLDLEKLRTLFNVSDPYPDLKLGKFSKAKDLSVVEWLMKMKKVNVLYLGRWQKSAEYHIEVESTEFLKGLKSMKELKLLSLQGISRINEPPSSIGKLSSLMILDLKACHNLEVLPDEIASLKKLRYMDVSDCYLLDHMPRGLYSLSELQVLKGFVVGNPQSGKKGTLDDLKGLKKLRKLSINASSEGFPTSKDILALQQLGKDGVLRKLTIAWGGRSKQGDGKIEAKSGSIFRSLTRRPTMIAHGNVEPAKKQDNSDPQNCFSKLTWRGESKQGDGQANPATGSPVEPKLPVELEKLDLQCFPEPTPPSWLNLGNLKSLKKLYVRGGRLKTLGNHQWSEVDTLCLKFLSEFKMTWRQLLEKFPKLSYLEKVDCPKITFCPCDENGVCLNPEKIE